MEEKYLRVAVLGFGAIGARVATELGRGAVPGAALAGVVVRREGSASSQGFAEIQLEEAFLKADLIVESAGGKALAELGPKIIAAGKDLLIVSVGVLADPAIREVLTNGLGRLFVSTGAVGGLDILVAAARAGGLSRAEIKSSKLPHTLVQPWMDEEEAERIRSLKSAAVIFSGSVSEAIEKFPKSLNVAVALAHATKLWDETLVTLVADPAATLTTHVIEASGEAGKYRFEMTNNVSPENPATSAIVAEALLSGIAKIAGANGSFV